MAALRYYYSDTISAFLTRSTDEIVGKLTLASQHDINDETSKSWVDEIESLRNLAPYKGRTARSISVISRTKFTNHCRQTTIVSPRQVPDGDHGVPPDETRKPEWYDGIYNYLKNIGIKEI